MNRTVVSGVAAFALFIGAALATNDVQAGHCGGGLFSKLRAKRCGGGLLAGHGGGQQCGGGLFARLRAKRAARNCCPAPDPCCQPAPAPCCQPAPQPCCDPAPQPCCEPAPQPCCDPAPQPCCDPAPQPCCGAPKRFSLGCGRKKSCCAPAPQPCCGSAPAPCGGCGGGEVAVGSGCTNCDGSATVTSDHGIELAPGETPVPGSVQTAGGGEELAAPVSSSDAGGDAGAEAGADAAPPVPTPEPGN